MNRSEAEKHKHDLVELSYTSWINAPGIVIENGIKVDRIIKRKVLNKRVGIITNTTPQRIVFLIDDEEDGIEKYIPYGDIVNIRKIKEYEAI